MRIVLPYLKPVTKVNPETLYSELGKHYGSTPNPNPTPTYTNFVGPGWNDILSNLHTKLVEQNPDYRITQVKEKFGTLRYYTNNVNEEGNLHIANAENLSAETCEQCGRAGKLRGSRRWLKTLCTVDNMVDGINKLSLQLERKLKHRK